MILSQLVLRFSDIERAPMNGPGCGRAKPMERKSSSFEEYWLASKAWERKGLPLAAARALANAGLLTVDDLRSADDLALASIPRVGPKSLATLYGLMGAKPRQPSMRRSGQYES